MALLTSPTIGDAANTAGVGERTLHTWLAEDEAFKTALRQAQDQAIDTAVSRLAGAATDAAHTLATIANNTAEKASTRVTASRAILDAVLRLSEHRDLVDRITRLEKQLNGQS